MLCPSIKTPQTPQTRRQKKKHGAPFFSMKPLLIIDLSTCANYEQHTYLLLQYVNAITFYTEKDGVYNNTINRKLFDSQCVEGDRMSLGGLFAAIFTNQRITNQQDKQRVFVLTNHQATILHLQTCYSHWSVVPNLGNLLVQLAPIVID